jgi:hypothetical protein
MTSTLLSCSVSIVPYVHFEPGTSKPTERLDWAWIVTQFKIALRPRERRLIVVGYADASEAANAAEVTRLAELRAKTIAQQLVKHGLDPRRIVSRVGDLEALRSSGVAFDEERVRFEFDPWQRVRDDYEPNSREYREFCGVKPRRGQ